MDTKNSTADLLRTFPGVCEKVEKSLDDLFAEYCGELILDNAFEAEILADRYSQRSGGRSIQDHEGPAAEIADELGMVFGDHSL